MIARDHPLVEPLPVLPAVRNAAGIAEVGKPPRDRLAQELLARADGEVSQPQMLHRDGRNRPVGSGSPHLVIALPEHQAPPLVLRWTHGDLAPRPGFKPPPEPDPPHWVELRRVVAGRRNVALPGERGDGALRNLFRRLLERAAVSAGYELVGIER